MKLVIDPGHGGNDAGAVANGLQEKDLNLQIAMRVKDVLQAGTQLEVKLTRETDIFVPLSERAAAANAFGADFFISFHINSGGGSGYEDYIYSGIPTGSSAEQKRSAIHNSVLPILQKYGLADRGKKAADFAVLRETAMDAVLVETAFIDAQADAALLANPQFIADISQAYAQGIKAALGL